MALRIVSDDIIKVEGSVKASVTGEVAVVAGSQPLEVITTSYPIKRSGLWWNLVYPVNGLDKVEIEIDKSTLGFSRATSRCYVPCIATKTSSTPYYSNVSVNAEYAGWFNALPSHTVLYVIDVPGVGQVIVCVTTILPFAATRKLQYGFTKYEFDLPVYDQIVAVIELA